ncbi:MAG: PHP domain-containing protein [Gammaproteobacteria bacterium]|nr:PHP domain-containing protein [Gammaproteobacteria bacterium]
MTRVSVVIEDHLGKTLGHMAGIATLSKMPLVIVIIPMAGNAGSIHGVAEGVLAVTVVANQQSMFANQIERSITCVVKGGVMPVCRLMAIAAFLSAAPVVCVIFGMEYSTPQGDFLLFGPFEELAPNLSADRLLSNVRDHGGAAVAAHPFRKARPADEQLIRKGLCHAVECVNGRNTPHENSAVEQWLRRYRLAQCGGSDAHTLDELGTFATRMLNPIQTRADLIQALQRGMCRPEIPA